MNGPLGRVIFPLFVLTMWVLFGVWLAQGDWTGLNWLMLGTAAVFCAIVFVEFISVFNFGYAFSMIVLPAEVLIVRGFDTGTLLIGGLSILFGLRLLVFTIRRRFATSWAPMKKGADAANAAVPTPLKAVIFVFTTTLQTFMGMAVYVIATNGGEVTAWVWAGAALMAIGLLLEWIADEQKQRAKSHDNMAFVRTGLYSRTRHPNYSGEIVFQVGLAIAAFGAVEGWWQWLAVAVAPAYIVVLMCFSAREADGRTAKRHANDPAYTEYVAATGSLLPGRGVRAASSR